MSAVAMQRGVGLHGCSACNSRDHHSRRARWSRPLDGRVPCRSAPELMGTRCEHRPGRRSCARSSGM